MLQLLESNFAQIQTLPVSHHESGFDPYEDNGGTTMAVSGDDFCIVAADTRQSNGYSINTRYAPKAYKLNDKIVLSTSGFYADGENFCKEIKKQMMIYEFTHEKEMEIESVAQLMQVLLYQKRFFPYYTFNTLGGIDAEGKGAVFSFDPVGSFEREEFRAGGSGGHLIQPLLDNLIGFKNQSRTKVPITKERATQIIKDAFTSATERDIYTGDCVEIFTISKNGVEMLQFALKRD